MLLFLLSVAVLPGSCIQAAQASHPVSISMKAKPAESGNKVTVKVMVGKSEGICAMDLSVAYPSGKLRYLSCRKGKKLSKTALTAIGAAGQDSAVSFSYVDLGKGIQKKQSVMEITFQARKRAKGKAKLKLSVGAFTDREGNQLDYKIKDRAIKIKKG